MRLPALLAAVLAAAVVAVPADASSSVLVTMDGPWGAVSIHEDRLFRLVDKTATLAEADLDRFLGTMTREEQIALEYAINPALITRYAVDDEERYPCGSTLDECDPPELQPKPEVEVEQPEPPPPAKQCAHVQTTQTWRNTVLRKDVMHFTQTAYRCWDGTLVSDVGQSASYDLTVAAIWWTCRYDELFPRYDTLPPADAPSVLVTATGHCSYRPAVRASIPFVGDFEVDLPAAREIFPRIEVTFDALGGVLKRY